MLIYCIFLLPIFVSSYNGRPQRYYIIDPFDTEPAENILNLQEINSQNLAEFVGDVDAGPASNEKTLNFLARYGLLPNRRSCPRCPNAQMSLVADKSLQLGAYWRCSSCKSAKITTKTMIRDGTFFEGSKLSIQKTLLLAADWIESPGRSAAETAKLFKVNHETVIHLYHSFRELTEQWWLRECDKPNLKLGGPGAIVEIDESHMFKAKHNRGRMLMRPAIWIFGMIERHTNKVSMFRVARRDAATLLPLIKDHVLNGSLVVSDGWAAYGGIRQLQANFTHKFVNHKVNFVDPSDRRVHTQSIEATWGSFKRELKSKYGVPEENLESYMAVYMFRRFHGRRKLLNHLMVEMQKFEKPPLLTPSPPTSDEDEEENSEHDSSVEDEDKFDDANDADDYDDDENNANDDDSDNNGDDNDADSDNNGDDNDADLQQFDDAQSDSTGHSASEDEPEPPKKKARGNSSTRGRGRASTRPGARRGTSVSRGKSISRTQGRGSGTQHSARPSSRRSPSGNLRGHHQVAGSTRGTSRGATSSIRGIGAGSHRGTSRGATSSMRGIGAGSHRGTSRGATSSIRGIGAGSHRGTSRGASSPIRGNRGRSSQSRGNHGNRRGRGKNSPNRRTNNGRG